MGSPTEAAPHRRGRCLIEGSTVAVPIETVLATLNALYRELVERRPAIRKADNYYRGKQSLAFASPEFRKFFGDRYTNFADNWVAIVADAPTERLEVTGFRPYVERGQADPDSRLWRLWMQSEADAESDMAFLESILASRSFALVWRDSDEVDPRITFESPSQAIVGYHPGTRSRRSGLKSWVDGSTEYATVYMPDDVYKFERDYPATNEMTDADGVPIDQNFGNDESTNITSFGGWRERRVDNEPWPLPNPLGEVPLVELPNRPRLNGPPESDISNVIVSQDAVNLMWAYLLNTADFASFPSRVVLGQERPTEPVMDASGEPTGNTREVPLERFMTGRVYWLDDEHAKIDQWPAADLSLFTKVIEVQVSHIASQTRTPHHYLIGKMANLSAEALKAAETGLVKRTEEKTKALGRALREVMRLVALADGRPQLAADMAMGTVEWADVESRSISQLADALAKDKANGFPFRWIAAQRGLTPPEIDQVMQWRDEEMGQVLGADLDAMLGPRAPSDDEDDEEPDTE